jgi:hypothetical protein
MVSCGVMACTSLWIVALVGAASAAAGALTVIALLALGVAVGKRHLTRRRPEVAE